MTIDHMPHTVHDPCTHWFCLYTGDLTSFFFPGRATSIFLFRWSFPMACNVSLYVQSR